MINGLVLRSIAGAYWIARSRHRQVRSRAMTHEGRRCREPVPFRRNTLWGIIMLFVSLQFVLLFLPLTIAGFFLLSSRHPEMSIAFLAGMSVIFFASSG